MISDFYIYKIISLTLSLYKTAEFLSSERIYCFVLLRRFYTFFWFENDKTYQNISSLMT